MKVKIFLILVRREKDQLDFKLKELESINQDMKAKLLDS